MHLVKESYQFILSLCKYLCFPLSRPLPVSCTHLLSHSQTEDPGRGWAEYSAQRPPLANLERYRGAKIGAPSHDIDKDLLCTPSLTRPRPLVLHPTLFAQTKKHHFHFGWVTSVQASDADPDRVLAPGSVSRRPPARHAISSLHTVRSTVKPAAHWPSVSSI